MNYKVIDSIWYTPMTKMAVIGVVAIETAEGKWKAYIGCGNGDNESNDAQRIAAQGSKVTKAMACAFFPQLDPEGFTY